MKRETTRRRTAKQKAAAKRHAIVRLREANAAMTLPLTSPEASVWRAIGEAKACVESALLALEHDDEHAWEAALRSRLFPKPAAPSIAPAQALVTSEVAA